MFRNGFFVSERESYKSERELREFGFFSVSSFSNCLRMGGNGGVFIPKNRPKLGGFPPRRRVSAQKWAGSRPGGGFPPKIGGFPPTRRVPAQLWAGFRPLGGFPPILGGFPPLGRVSA